MSFLAGYLSTLAALFTILGTIVAFSHWFRRQWGRYFLAKPRGELVDRDFGYHDIHAGINALVKDARRYDPEVLVGINRGGAIVGGIIGKHLGLLVRVIDVSGDSGQVADTGLTKVVTAKRVLLIDDRLSTGVHMSMAYDHLQQCAGELRSAVFAWVELPKAKRLPDFYGYRAASADISFPWEPGASREWAKSNA